MKSWILEQSIRLRSLLPNSKASILLACVVTWALSITSVSRCTFVRQESISEESFSVEMGMFSKAVYDDRDSILGCVSYTDADAFDVMFQVARVSGVLSSVCSSMVLLFVSTAILFCPRTCNTLWSWSRFLLATGTIGQLFTFSIMNSTQCQGGTTTCQLQGVGKLTIFNILLLAGLSVKLFWEDRPFHPSLYLRADALETDTIVSDRTSRTDPHVKTNDFKSNNQQIPARSTEDLQESGQIFVNGVPPNGIHTYDYANPPSVVENTELSIQHLRSFRCLTMLLVTVAWIISIVGTSRCTLLLVGPKGGSRADYSGLGLFSRAAYHNSNLVGCLAYPSYATDDFDAAFQASRVFGAITAFLMTAIFFLCSLLLFFKRAKEEIWIMMRILMPCAMVCQILVFVAFKTQTCSASDLAECRPGPSGIAVIFNVFLLVILSFGFFIIPPPPGPIFRFHNDHQNDSSTMTSRGMRQQGQTVFRFPERAQRQTPNHARRVVAVRPPGSPISATSLDLPSLQHSPCPDSSLQNTSGSNEGAPKRVRIATEPAETIMVQVEYSEKEKRTIKTVTHPDGSKTITTTIERYHDPGKQDIPKTNKPLPSVQPSAPAAETMIKPKVEEATVAKGPEPKKPDAVASPVALKNALDTSVGRPQVPEFFLKLSSLKKTNCLSAQEMAEQAKQESNETSNLIAKKFSTALDFSAKSTESVHSQEEDSRPVLPETFFEQKVSMHTGGVETEAPAEPIASGVKNLRQMFEKGSSE